MVKHSLSKIYNKHAWRIALLSALLGVCTPIIATGVYSQDSVHMTATYYADKFHGRRTSSGEIFDQNKATAAHYSIKLGTWVRVTNLKNDMQVVVKINDRCPKRGIIDLSRSAAHSIGIKGTAKVLVEILASEEEALRHIALAPKNEPKQPTTVPATTANSPLKKKENKRKENSQKKPQQKENATTTNSSATDNERYNIVLGHASTLKEAQTKTEHIPIPYRDYVKLQPDSKQADILILLETRLPRKKAEQILLKTNKNFPEGKLVKTN